MDAIEKLDEDTIITGSSDGILRVLSVQPHNLLGILAQQAEGGCERMALSCDRQLLATTSYGMLRIWDTTFLNEDGHDDSEGEAANNSVKSFIKWKFLMAVVPDLCLCRSKQRCCSQAGERIH